MSRHCLSAALLVLLVSLVDSTPAFRNNIQDRGLLKLTGQKMIFGRHHEKRTVQEFPTQILKKENKGASKPDFCMEPILTGVCKAVMVRYFYNASAGLCDQFIYGICGGNKNNFPSEKECMETCNPKA